MWHDPTLEGHIAWYQLTLDRLSSVSTTLLTCLLVGKLFLLDHVSLGGSCHSACMSPLHHLVFRTRRCARWMNHALLFNGFSIPLLCARLQVWFPAEADTFLWVLQKQLHWGLGKCCLEKVTLGLLCGFGMLIIVALSRISRPCHAFHQSVKN